MKISVGVREVSINFEGISKEKGLSEIDKQNTYLDNEFWRRIAEKEKNIRSQLIQFVELQLRFIKNFFFHERIDQLKFSIVSDLKSNPPLAVVVGWV